jgi:ribose transport system substrate-binding protein
MSSHTFRLRRRAGAVFAALVACALITAGCGSSDSTSSSSSTAAQSAKKDTYTIYLSNSFMGNSFRVLMEKMAVVAADEAPLKGRVDLKIANSETSVTAQMASLNQVIQQKPDAIILTASSSTALNAVIQRACSQGIVVVSFDEIVTAPCAWKVSADAQHIADGWANWFAKSVKGDMEVFQDLGLAGNPLAKLFSDGLKKAQELNPKIKVTCTFQSKYALGPEQEGVAKCLGAHPNVDGVWAMGYAGGAMKALDEAGHPQVPVTGGAYNVGTTNCFELKGECLLASYPAYIGALALKTAVEILDGDDPPKDQSTKFPFFQQGGADTKVPDETVMPLELDVNVFPKLDGGLVLPWQLPWAPQVTLDQIQAAKI